MASIFLCPAYPPVQKAEKIANKKHGALARLAELSRYHHLAAHPNQADLVLLEFAWSLHLSHLDPWRKCLFDSPVFSAYGDKSLVVDFDDSPLPLWRGLYASPDRKWYDPNRNRTIQYLCSQYLWEKRLDCDESCEDAPYLFSFIGALVTDPVRKRIGLLSDERSLIADTSYVYQAGDKPKHDYRSRYIDSIHKSKFVLCPRGRGTASVRFYEVLRAGRVPVVISDAWVPPEGPDWHSCMLVVPQAEIGSIPRRLREKESKAPDMGKAARAIWDTWFSPEVAFDRLVESAFAIQENTCGGQSKGALIKALKTQSQMHRAILGPLKRRVLSVGKRRSKIAK